VIGELIDRRYKIDELLGEGGMGVVYGATHVLIGKRVALKVLRRDHAKDHEAISRFMREAQLASAIKHPNVVDLSDFGQLSDGRVYYVMERLDGRSLADRVDHDGPLPPDAALRVAIEIAKGLAAAHRHGIVHRDLKPDNVFLCDVDEGDPVAKLFDFGIARAADSRLTRPGAVLGTPEYMSPEQATGVPVDGRADLYALGVILMELLTGQVPFATPDLVELIRMQMTVTAPKLSEVAPALSYLGQTEALIENLLRKDPADRVATAEEVIARLQAARRDEATAAPAGRPGRATQAIGSGGAAGDEAAAAVVGWAGPRRTVAFRGGAWSRATPIASGPTLAPTPESKPSPGAPSPVAADRSAGLRLTEPQSLVHTPAATPPRAVAAAPVPVEPAKTASAERPEPARSGLALVGWGLAALLVVGLGAGGVLAVQHFGAEVPPAPARTGTVAESPVTPTAVAPEVAAPAATADQAPVAVVPAPPPAPPSSDLPDADVEDATPIVDPPPQPAVTGSKGNPAVARKPKAKSPPSAGEPPVAPDVGPVKTPPTPPPPVQKPTPPPTSSTDPGSHAFELRDPFGRK
jgi:serine/threonine-protein kinase